MLPLEGLRVVDLSRALAGPLCTMLLGDLGADVVKVEEPGVGDDSRHWGPPFAGGESAYFLAFNRNKRGVGLNLKRPGGKEALWRLIDRADVFIENFRPGLIDRLGFGYAASHARNPRLIYCSISGFGQDGPEAERAGYDIILQGMSGVVSLTGEPEGDPMRCGLPVCDVLAGMFAVQGVLAALQARERTGEGQKVETTLLGATVAALGNFALSYLLSGSVPPRVGNSHAQIAPYDLLRTADGHLYVACGNDGIWRRFCAALGLDALPGDPRFRTNADRVTHRAALLEAIEAVVGGMTTRDLLARLDAAGVPAGPIQDMRQVLESAQARHLGLVQTLEHPSAGSIPTIRPAVDYSATPTNIRQPAPRLGEHTDEVLGELGYDEATIAGWHRDGTL